MYETMSAAAAAKELDADLKNGLSDEEAAKRKAEYGPNKLAEKKRPSAFMIFLGEFKDPMVIVLFIAAIISLALAIVNNWGAEETDWTEYIDVVIIFAVVVLNSTIGTVQEVKAEKALEALKRMSAPTATVRRGGRILQNIPAEDLVPGDIVILEEGRNVPADLRLISAHSLKADESSLTGESVPVEKDASIILTDAVGVGDRVNEVYMSTPVVYGRGEGLVIATGMNTEIGHIASLLQGDEDEMTPLQKKLAQLSKFLGYLTLGIVILIFGVQLIYSAIENSIASEWSEALLTSVGLAVAAIPEGLPAVVTIVLALGMQKMAKVNTIVRRLASVETLGSVSVICSDKTGTLTQNQMTVVAAYADGNYEEENLGSHDSIKLLAKGMALCSDASIENGVYGDPTEVALVRFASDLGMPKSSLEQETPRIGELPFDSVRKMMSTKHQEGDKEIVYTKGALDLVLAKCGKILKKGKAVKITEADKASILEASSKMASKALRVLSLAYRTDGVLQEDNLTFIGLVGMVDPPRPAAKGAVETLKGAGITTIMITGDHKDTAFAIAKELGIADSLDQVMSGDQIDACAPEELQKRVETVRVFARVSPENKVSIVKAIKANGHIAAMTGDGVNDAPSLKAADIGIAMGITGTDVAKGAADMVLVDDNFTSIEKAVEEGRGIYTNIRKTIYFLLSSNIGEVIAMFVAIVIGLPAPLIAIHLLWVNLVTDSLPAIALGADKKPDDIMHDQPRDPNDSLFAHGGYFTIIVYGCAIGLATILAFLIKPWQEGCFSISAINTYFADETKLEEAQSMAFCVLAMSELFHMLGMTDTKHTFLRVFKDKNLMLWLAFFVGFALQLFVIEVPGVNTVFSVYTLSDNPIDYAIVFGFALIPLFLHEIIVFVLWIKNKVGGKGNRPKQLKTAKAN